MPFLFTEFFFLLGYFMKLFLRPNVFIKILINVISIYGLVGAFYYGIDFSFFIYIFYFLSTYTLVIDCIWIFDIGLFLKNLFLKNTLIKKWADDMGFRAVVALYGGLLINVIYGIFVGYLGFHLSSIWWGSLAFYYLILGLARFNIILNINRADSSKAWVIYRQTGSLMIILILVITGMGIVSFWGQYTSPYSGYMIYAMAAYSFYSLGLAIYNIIRYHALNNPLYSASKILCLSIALVSIYSLQLAMLSVFSDGSMDVGHFNEITGGCFALIIFGIGLFMILNSKKHVR